MLRFAWYFLIVLVATAAPAEGSDHRLFGDWAGMLPAMESAGVTAEAALTTDLLYNTRGGVDEDGTILGNLDLTFEVDTGRAGWWNNGRFFLYLLGNFNFGGPMTENIGDVQGTSNIEADEALKIHEAWYEHRFHQDRISLLGGLHDFNGEFSVLEYASPFMNGSFGISPDISQVGPSLFPTTALGGRLKVLPTGNTYLMAAVYDGVPGDPDDPLTTAIILKKEDGIFAGFETGLTNGRSGAVDYYKLAAGAWLHTAHVENFDRQPNKENRGLYVIGEKTLYAEAEDGQGLGVFFQFGLADGQWNQIGSYWGLGLHYRGLIPGRDNDVIGIAVASARNSDHFMDFVERAGGGVVNRAETTIELTYRGEVFPWLTLQPDMQYVINPGMDPAVKDALQVGLRLELSL